MFCEKCGTKLDEWIKFCSNCGHEVAKSADNDSTVKSAVNTPNNTVAKEAYNAPTAKKVENVQDAKTVGYVPIVNVNVQTRGYAFKPLVLVGALLSIIAYFLPFYQADILGYTEETSYISIIEEIDKSAASLKNKSSNSLFDNYTPMVGDYISSLAADARKIEIILCIPILLSAIAFLCSFRKPGRAGFFAILSGVSLAAIVFYVSVQYEDALSLMSDFSSLRIGAFLYLIGIFMTILGQLGRKKN